MQTAFAFFDNRLPRLVGMVMSFPRSLPRQHDAGVPAVGEEIAGAEADSRLRAAREARHEAVRRGRLPRIHDVAEVVAGAEHAASVQQRIAAEDAEPARDLEAGVDVELRHDDEVVLTESAAI